MAAPAGTAAAIAAGGLPTLTALDEELDRMIAALDAEAFEKCVLDGLGLHAWGGGSGRAASRGGHHAYTPTPTHKRKPNNRATRMVKKRFNEQVHLDDVPELRAEYKKKLSSIELQLSGMVQVKVRTWVCTHECMYVHTPRL